MSRLWITCLVIAVGVRLPSGASAPQAAGTVAFTDVTLVDIKTGERRAPITILLRGSRIATVGRSDSVMIPAGATVIPSRGRYVLPGLVDTHVHLSSAWLQPTTVDTLAVLRWILASGVTTIRDAGSPTGSSPLGFTGNYASIRAAAESGRVLAPRIVIAQYLGAGARFGAQAPDERVQRLRERGVDQIKLFGVGRDAAIGTIAVARRAGMPAWGHTDLGAQRFTMTAVRAGISGVTHITGTYAVDSDTSRRIDQEPGASVEGELLAFRHWLHETAAQQHALIDSMIARHVWLEPTLSLLEFRNAIYDVCGDGYDAAAVRGYLPWGASNHALAMSRAQRDSLLASCRRMWDFVNRFWRSGGIVIAGSGFVPFAPFGVAREAELLTHRASLSPLAAIQAATVNATTALGIADDVGTIEPGKRADLLMLDADPLEDISNLRRVVAVVANGRLLDRRTLDRLLQ